MTTRVILVEDDLDDRDLFEALVKRRDDIELLPTVGNGRELIAYLDSTINEQQLPELIILDQNMPLMNGKQTLKYLGSHTRYASIPAVIYSTYADTTLIVDCKQLGAKMVADKPIDEKGYQKMINDFLKVVHKM